METNNDTGKNENKRLIIICATIVLVAAMLLGSVLIIKNSTKKHEDDMFAELSGFEMTYEDFTYGMKGDLSPEVIEQVKKLYDDFTKANEEGDNEAIIKIFEELDKLEVYDEAMMENMNGYATLTEEELAELDPDGDGVIVFEGDEIPEEFEAGGN